MKTCGVVLVALVLSLLSAGNCPAGGSGLQYKVSYEINPSAYGYQEIVVVGIEGAGKGDDGNEGLWPSMPSTGILLGIRKVNGVDGWDGTTGWYSGDIREYATAGHSVTVDGIHMWAVPETPSQDMHLRLTMAWLYPSENGSFTLSLLSVPQGVEYTGPTIWGPETTEITLPFYSTDDGTTGYRFQMNVFAVPEPSSLLVLAGGLAGMGVSLVRRRR